MLPPLSNEGMDGIADAFGSMNVGVLQPQRPAVPRHTSPMAQQRIQTDLVREWQQVRTHLLPVMDHREAIVKVEAAANLYLEVLRDVARLAEGAATTPEVAFEQLLQRGHEVSVDCSPFRDQCSLAHQCRSIGTLVRLDLSLEPNSAAEKFETCQRQLQQVEGFCKQLRSAAITQRADCFELLKQVQADAARQ